MAETKVEIDCIEHLSVSAKLVDVKVEGGEKGETEKRLFTQVTFVYEGPPGSFDTVLMALLQGLPVGVAIGSPQANLALPK